MDGFRKYIFVDSEIKNDEHPEFYDFLFMFQSPTYKVKKWPKYTHKSFA